MVFGYAGKFVAKDLSSWLVLALNHFAKTAGE